MNQLYFFFIGLLIIPVNAFGQVNDQVNYEKCEYVIFNSNVYAPFYVHINHDPAIAQTFKSRHDDNPAVVPFQRAPEGVEPGQATWFEFGSAQNATATYDFELDLEYATILDHPRVIIMQLYMANNALMFEKKFYQEGINGCLAVKIHAVPPPHEFTIDEILQIADQQNAATTKVYATNIESNTLEIRGMKDWQIVQGMIVGGLVISLMVYIRSEKRKLSLVRQEYELRNRTLLFAIEKQDVNNSWLDLNLKAIKWNNDKLIQSVVGVFGDMLQKIETSISNAESKFTKLIDDMRKELELIEQEHESVITFADEKGHAIIKIEQPTPEEPVKPEETFGFDISALVKEPFKIFQKHKKPVEEKKDNWDDMTNEKLIELEREYVKKANDDLETGLGYTDNYTKAEKLNQIINSRKTNIEDEK